MWNISDAEMFGLLAFIMLAGWCTIEGFIMLFSHIHIVVN